MRFALILVLLAFGPALTEIAWEETALPSGARLLVVDSDNPGQAMITLAWPAGMATSLENPDLALLAPRLFLQRSFEGGRSLKELLRGIAWGWKLRLGRDNSFLQFFGPKEEMPEVIGALLEEVGTSLSTHQGEVDAAFESLQKERSRWRKNPEIFLRAGLDSLRYPGHPYRIGEGKALQSLNAPLLEDMQTFLTEHYGANSCTFLILADLDPDAFLSDWLPRFDALTGKRKLLSLLPEDPGSRGDLEMEGSPGRTLLLWQFPLPGGWGRERADIVLASGIIQPLLVQSFRGLVASATASCDFLPRGPARLEIQVRGFLPGDLPRIEKTLERILDRLGKTEFSEMQVVTAKDQVLQRLSLHSSRSDRPLPRKETDLRNWSLELLRQQLSIRDKRSQFELAILKANMDSIAERSRRYLTLEQRSRGLLQAP